MTGRERLESWLRQPATEVAALGGSVPVAWLPAQRDRVTALDDRVG